jgi:hypothetical protein
MRRRGTDRPGRAPRYHRRVKRARATQLSVTIHRMISGGSRTIDGRHASRRIDATFDKVDPKTTRFNRGGSWSGTDQGGAGGALGKGARPGEVSAGPA